MINWKLSGQNKSEMFKIIRKQGKKESLICHLIHDIIVTCQKSKIKLHLGTLGQEYKEGRAPDGSVG